MSAAERWAEEVWLVVVCPGCGHAMPGIELGPGGVVRAQCRAKRTQRPAGSVAGHIHHLRCGAWVEAYRVGEGPVATRRIYRPRRARHTLTGQEDDV